MYTVNFYGPVHLGNFGSHTKKQKDSPHTKGVYVWGFAYDKNGFRKFKKQTDFNPETMKFLPYYVGKHESSILNRIIQHKNFRYTGSDKNIHAPKYIRLSMDYMFEFYRDKEFPIITSDKRKKLIELIEANKPNKTVTYHNNVEVLNSIYPHSKAVNSGTDHPITLQSFINEDDDTLFKLAESYNNFYFCYIPVKTNELRIKYLEHYLFYCLKGKTVSQTNTFPKEGEMSPELFKLVDKTKLNILKKNASGEIIASNDFPGY